MRISDWSSDVCSSDLIDHDQRRLYRLQLRDDLFDAGFGQHRQIEPCQAQAFGAQMNLRQRFLTGHVQRRVSRLYLGQHLQRSEEHTSELQSLLRISYAVFCLKKTTKKHNRNED